jgi:hypothetical protein
MRKVAIGFFLVVLTLPFNVSKLSSQSGGTRPKVTEAEY